MSLYEHVFIARQDISAQKVEGLIATFTTLITGQGGEVSKSEYWGLRPLAYRIKKNRRAHYALLNIAAPPEAIAEMERQMTLNDDIVRFLTIRVEAHNPDPSPLMPKAPAESPESAPSGPEDKEKREAKPEAAEGKEKAGETAPEEPAPKEPEADKAEEAKGG